MFQLKKELIADEEIITINHPDGKSTFSTVSSLGASLFKLRLSDQHLSENILKSWDDPSTFVTEYNHRFSGAQLFPFPNRLAQGAYRLDGKKYHFSHNDFGRSNALHGHLYKRPFRLENWEADQGILTLEHDNDGKDSAYPFSYSIKNQFSLTENTLTIATTILNTSSYRIPIGYGWHPYFRTVSSVDEYFLEIPSSALLEVDEALIPTGNLLPFHAFIKRSKVLGRQLDNCLLINENGQSVKLIDPTKKSCISLDISQFDYLQVYIPPERDAIALEPQNCAPDAFNNELGLLFLDSEETKTYTFQISFEALAQKE